VRLHRREEADTDNLRKPLVFTVDHLHPQVRGGRGRANKVPACKYCNTRKSSRTVEEFRDWVRVRATPHAQDAALLPDDRLYKRWLVSAEQVTFYFELTDGSSDRQ
jgi:hypothetical protein